MLSRYEDAFSDLNVGRSRGHEKPHKPIMLLAVMDLIESGRIRENQIEFEPGLLGRFKAYFDIVKSVNDSLTPLLPFFHLRGDKFWHHHPRPGQESTYQALSNPGGKGKFLGVVDHAYLDDALFQLLCDPDTREQLRQTIVSRYFAPLSSAIAVLLRQERPIGLYEDFLRKKVVGKVAEDDAPDADADARDAAFSRVVRAVYDYRCAACGLRVFLDDGTILVDAAHIIPFSVSKDNDPRNGMALCRNHHWAMDKYLVAPIPAKPRPLWRVSKDLDRRIEGQTDLLSLDGTAVLQPRDARYHPREDTLKWRMEHLRTTA
jgi:putative restriction endonuclease